MCINPGTSSGFKFTRTKLIILIFYNHDGTALCLPVILVSLVVLALLAAFVSLVAVVLFLLLFALCLLPFCITTAPTYRLFCNQPPVLFSLGSSTTSKKDHWCRIHIQWIRLYLLSRWLCHGLLLCLSKVIFVMQPMISLDKIIFTEKANMASEKPPPKGSLVSGCPVGKVCKTYVSSWSF